MSRPPIPIGQINRRIPEAGRIRTGEVAPTRNGGSRPKATSDFIFTSAERNNVEAIAAIHGGEVAPYKSQGDKSPDRWMVRPGVTEIPVALPADPLGGTPLYEQYGGGGATHRCDGILCTKYRKGPDGGPEPYEVDCECAAAGVLACNVTTHLSVFLQGVRLTGVWRLTTKSYNAAQELPGMVEQIQTLQSRGIVRAVLSLKPHRQVLAGITREFLVPQLGVDATLEELAAGHASVAALPAAPAATETPVALNAGGMEGGGGDAPPLNGNGRGAAPDASATAPPSGDPDDEIVDAEIVGEEGGGVDNPAPAGAPGVVAEDPPAPSPAGIDLEDLAAVMKQKGKGKAAVKRIYNEHAERLSQPQAKKWDDIVPGAVLDATFAEIDGDDDPPPASSGPAPAGDGEAPDDAVPPVSSGAEPDASRLALLARITEAYSGRPAQDEVRHAVLHHATGGRTESSRGELTPAEWQAAHRALDGLLDGSLVLMGAPARVSERAA